MIMPKHNFLLNQNKEFNFSNKISELQYMSNLDWFTTKGQEIIIYFHKRYEQYQISKEPVFNLVSAYSLAILFIIFPSHLNSKTLNYISFIPYTSQTSVKCCTNPHDTSLY